MRVRGIVLLLAFGSAALAAQTPAPPAAPPPQQPPVFRTGVDLLTIDATVVDREGRQVTDLKPEEFQVEVDGDARPVVTAEYVKLVDETPIPVGATRAVAPTASPDDAYFSTNSRKVGRGRAILLLVDQGNIRTGRGRGIMRSAVKFVDGLAPEDRVAMVAIPQGQLVDFTTSHEAVREALLSTVGLATPYKGRFNISLTEAFAIYEGSDQTLRAQTILRECGQVSLSPVEAARCELEVEQEAAETVSHERLQTQNSLRGMREVLRSIAALDGPKSVILISEGLLLEGLGSEVDDIASLAADARASLDVLLLDVPSVDVAESQRPTTAKEDRERQVTGLEMLAGMSRGGLHRIVSSGDSAFQRIMRSIAGHYLLGVESRPRDRDGRRHRIQVKTTRRGVTVQSRRGFLATSSPGAVTPAEAVKRALSSPLPLNELAMRLATWIYKEPGTPRMRLLLSAEVARAADQPLDYTAGIAFVGRDNKVAGRDVQTQKLRMSESDPATAVYSGSVIVEPGIYLLRVALADSEGRIGSIERRVEVFAMNPTGLSLGDLMVASVAADSNTTIPAIVEPIVDNGRLATMIEVYGADVAQSLQTIQGTVDILPSADGRPLTSTAMQIRAGTSAEIAVLDAAVNIATLPPGRYLARATVALNGKPQGHLLRPFRVTPAARTTAAAGATLAAPLPADLLGALLANLPPVDRQELLSPEVMKAVLAAAEKARPTAKAALATARAGTLGPAALEALAAGDQTMAAFIRGVDFFAQGNTDRALQQLQVAVQQAPTFAPARLYLGATLASTSRYREAAGLLQSVSPDIAGPAAVARLAGLSWLHAGEAALAVETLSRAEATPGTARMLGLAYVAANRPADGAPLLVKHLETNPKDQAVLLAAIYSVYAAHVPTPDAQSLAGDRARAQALAKTYAALKGSHQALVDAWIGYLQGAK